MIEQFEHDAHRDRLRQVSSAPKVPNRLNERDRKIMEEWDHDTMRAADGRGVRGVLIGLAVVALMSYGIYRVMAWYVSTMPPHSFIGLHKDAR